MYNYNLTDEKTQEKSRMKRSISERVNKIGISSTMKVAAEAKKMKAKGIPVIDLSVGEPDFPTPQNIKDAAIKAILEDQTKYTLNNGTVELRKAIASKLLNENGLEYSIEDIIVSNGAKQSLFNAVHTLIYNDDEVVIPAPYWVSYPEMVTLAHGKSVIVETKPENGFKITPEELRNAITPRTKVLILCNPSNPTGSAYTRHEMESLAEIIEEENIYVISDEIYEKLVYDDFKFVSFPSLSEEMKKRTVLINGVSKSHAMTGWRIGYSAGPEEVIKGINKIQSHSTSNASSISQAAAVEALMGPQTALEEMRSEFEKRRNYMFEELNSIGGIKCYKPEGAFYLFPDLTSFFNKSTDVIRISDSFDLSMYLLYEAKIASVPGSSFGSEGFIRFSYATSMENIKEAMIRLKEALGKLK
ncbi:MAG TPA: pyridoxal phosphate-dependent aminotransferase [Ignavibacteriaceae bacterium]|nr:pyridoxal phosphate-dependent aminotransferase [Ignavibacteriaceae bacterium]